MQKKSAAKEASAKIDAALKDLDGFLKEVQSDSPRGNMTPEQYKANCEAADFQFGF